MNRDLIESNPVERVVWSMPRDSAAFNINTVPSVADVTAVVEGLAATEAYAHYAAFFAVIGLAGLRPSEAARLRVHDLALPASGWGEAHVPGAVTSPGSRYTSDGEAMEEKGLKQRAVGETRTVPLPPVLVGWLRWHLDRFEKSSGDRVFSNARGGDLSKDNWGRPWRLQRAKLWPAGHKLAEAATYDLRHTAATLMLRAGVSPAEAALRLGHSVDMLMKVYAGVFDDERLRSNDLIQAEFSRQLSDRTATERPCPG